MRKCQLFLVVMAATACGRGDRPVIIGVAGPLSQARGAPMRLAAQLAEREINARGGVAGRRLELVFADDSARDSVAMRVAARLGRDPRVLAVAGHLTSAATRAALPFYAAADPPVPLVSPSAGSPTLSGSSPFFFRVCPNDLAYGSRLARLARQQLGARTAGILYTNDLEGRSIRRTFATEFERLGGVFVAQDPALPGIASVEPYLARIARRGGVDVLVLALNGALAALAVREKVALGAQWPVVGGPGLLDASASVAQGMHVASAYLPDRGGTLNAAFVEAYRRAYPGQTPDQGAAGTYDVVHLLARVIADGASDRRAVRERLARIGTTLPTFEGVTGPIAFDEQGDVPAKPVVVGVMQGGRWVTEHAP